MRSLNNYQDAENISLELGWRAYQGLSAESENIIHGISILKFAEMLQDEYNAGDPAGADRALRFLPWGAMWGNDTLHDFELETGLAIMYQALLLYPVKDVLLR